MPTKSQRQRLYQNALELFYTKGFKATTMRDIAGAMNFEAASLYNYFKSKDALLEELLFDVADQFLDGIQLIKATQQSHKDKLATIIKLYVQVTSTNPYKAALLTNEWRNLKEPVLTRFIDHRTAYEGHLKEILGKYYSQNNNTSIDIDIVLHTFLGSTRWIYDWYIKQEGAVNTDELQVQLSNIILNGLLEPSR